MKFFTGFSRENAYYKNHLPHLKLTRTREIFAIINSKNEMVLKLQKTAIAESPNLSLNFDSAERFSEFRVEIWFRSIEPNSELFEKPVKSIDSPELMSLFCHPLNLMFAIFPHADFSVAVLRWGQWQVSVVSKNVRFRSRFTTWFQAFLISGTVSFICRLFGFQRCFADVVRVVQL